MTPEAQAERPKRYALAVELTSACNQRCSYCYNDFRDDPKKVKAISAQDLAARVDRALTEVDFDHVTLTGGEPFASVACFPVLEVLKKHRKRCLIISNGGLITQELAARLAAYDVMFVQVTLNAPERTLHDHLVDPEAGPNAGHFDGTLRGIAALRANGVTPGGSIVITRKNARLVGEILALFQRNGVQQIALSRYSPAGFAAESVSELLPSRTDMVTALDLALPFAKAGMSLQVTMPVPPCVIDTSAYPEISFSACPIGTEMQEFALGSDGKIRNCTLHEEPLGDVATDSVAAIVTSDAVMHYRDVTHAFCAPCPMRAQCIGGCGAAAKFVFGQRGLDPFVGQHVLDDFGAGLKAARATETSFVPAGRLVRRRAEPVA